jgi:deoxycytidylate deaminase
VFARVYRGISYAVEAARGSDCPTYLVGAALMKGNRLVASDCNSFHKTNPRTTNLTRKVHAEFRVANQRNLRGYTMYVARVRINGTIGMARPCPDCLRLLIGGGIREIWFTNRQGLPERLIPSQPSVV